jgi:hypothetical protein
MKLARSGNRPVGTKRGQQVRSEGRPVPILAMAAVAMGALLFPSATGPGKQRIDRWLVLRIEPDDIRIRRRAVGVACA